jgi:hypothetical protein
VKQRGESKSVRQQATLIAKGTVFVCPAARPVSEAEIVLSCGVSQRHCIPDLGVLINDATHSHQQLPRRDSDCGADRQVNLPLEQCSVY